MARASVWFQGADMLVRYTGFVSSTSTGSFINSSTGFLVSVWASTSTGDTALRVVTNRPMPYVAASNGDYQALIQSTDHSLTAGSRGMAVVSVVHAGINDARRQAFLVEYRALT